MVSPADQFAVAHAAFLQWRLAHPHATLAEIEAQFDHALSPLRSAEIARSAVDDAPQATPICPECQRPMQRHGVRPVTCSRGTTGISVLTSHAIAARSVGPSFPPLSERLGLVPGTLSPWVAELAVQYGSTCSFATAARLLNQALRTRISDDTVRRVTEAAGAVWCQVELDVLTAHEAAVLTPGAPPVAIPDPDPFAPTATIGLCLDGAMVPLVDGEWQEVRTLTVSRVVVTDAEVRTTDLSYVSQLAPAAVFAHTIGVELTRRGVLTHPGTVVAVSDGAVWIQEALDLQVPQAERVLDVMHAVEYLADAAKASFGPETAATSEWLGIWRHALRAGRWREVLTALEALPSSPERTNALRYLGSRTAMLAYDRCDRAGWPVGSGTVESANKLVVEARMKGAGRHWHPGSVNPMVGLCAVMASRRWEQAWPRIVAAWRNHRPAARASSA